ncbi:MAG TPA: acyl-ACP--UDP-N-acetylglucosamine O-acyltransferase [Saprospiraceae bacterium]|jgi:UDP-N-acetylglucosamine acyltransferase|nr:acyl-ACP--UDP-N-acetylglucosamine O-acyltransferase [Saprospiraceae bacterium]HOJ91129.1 acyl-ACP--UDP-N-acetylglucosamine O-acyltransferase [Saprospiraceae bacterium]HUN17768.1 acyl-ACP--UDP-N-acetylglucosamine O-acyltransferase [Saprospiraceae bacterium]
MSIIQSNIHRNATIGKGTVIEPFATIQEDVVLGENCWVGPYVTIMDGTRIGNNVKIFPGAVVGAPPQDLKYAGEPTTLEIGDGTIVREFCTLNRGTKASMTTKIGKNCLLMAYVHVAHDCFIGDNVILANNVNLAGHIDIDDYAILGGLTAVHQFVKIGKHVMIGGGSLVMKDVPHFVKAARDPLSYEGVNSVGLKRRGFTVEQINRIHDIYRYLFIRHRNIKKALPEIALDFENTPEKDIIMEFIQKSERGLMKGIRK